MSDPAFPLISDLTPQDQAELQRIQSIPSAFRTTSETAYLNARLPYTKNFILSNSIKKGAVTPNGVAASALFALSGTVSNGELVRIGNDTYEFRTSGSAAAGHIKVNVSGGADATSAGTALATAMASGVTPVNALSASGGNVTIAANDAGTPGNLISVSTTCVNGAWQTVGDNLPTSNLTGGQFAILANQVDFYFSTGNNTLWIALVAITSNLNTDGWHQITTS